MMTKGFWFGMICLFLASCAVAGPYQSSTQVNLSKNNYRVVKTNVIGESNGLNLFGIIPLTPCSYTEAANNLSTKAGLAEDKALAITNVQCEYSSIYLILFSLPKKIIRADVVEFTGKE